MDYNCCDIIAPYFTSLGWIVIEHDGHLAFSSNTRNALMDLDKFISKHPNILGRFDVLYDGPYADVSGFALADYYYDPQYDCSDMPELWNIQEFFEQNRFVPLNKNGKLCLTNEPRYNKDIALRDFYKHIDNNFKKAVVSLLEVGESFFTIQIDNVKYIEQDTVISICRYFNIAYDSIVLFKMDTITGSERKPTASIECAMKQSASTLQCINNLNNMMISGSHSGKYRIKSVNTKIQYDTVIAIISFTI